MDFVRDVQMQKREDARVRIKDIYNNDTNLSKQRILDIDELNLNHFVDLFNKVPYFRCQGKLGVEKKFEKPKIIKLSTDFGIAMTLEFKNGKWDIDTRRSGFGVGFNVFSERSLGITKQLTIDNTCDWKTRLVNSKNGIRLNNSMDNVFYLQNGQRKFVKLLNEDILIIGAPLRIDFCKLAHINGEIGIDMRALVEAIDFLARNRHSIKSGFVKTIVRTGKEYHKKVGKGLQEYLDMPCSIE